MLYLIPLFIFFGLFALLAWRDFFLALGLMLLLLPSYLVRFDIGPLPSTALEGMFAILFLIWVIRIWRKGDWQQAFEEIRSSLFFWPGLLLILAAGISVFVAPNTKDALGILKAYFIEPFLLYCILATTVKEQKQWEQLLLWLGGSLFFFGVLATIQYFTGWGAPEWQWTQPGSRRAAGLYTSPNALGLYAGPILVLYLGWALLKNASKRWMVWYQYAAIFFGAAALVFSVSRGAWIAVILASLFLFAKLWSWKKTAVIAALSVVFLLFIPAARQEIVSLAGFQVESGQSRLVLYEGTMQLFTDHPVRGLGLSGFNTRFEEVRPPSFTENLIYPHSFFLNFWSETGLLGVIAVVWMICIVIREYRRSDHGLRAAFAAALLVVLLHGLVDVSYFKNDLAMLAWVLLAGFEEKERSRLSNTTPGPSLQQAHGGLYEGEL